MMNLPLNAIRAFAYVYEAKGIRSAARQLGVSHSAVSRHVSELEAWLGTALLESRTGQRRSTFTANGKILGEAAVYNLQALNATTISIREARQANSVVISTAASFAALWLLPRLSDLQNKSPNIEISVLTEQKVIDPDGIQIDIAIRMGQGPWGNNHCTPLMDDLLYPVVHPELMKGSRRNPLNLFSQHSLIHDRDPDTSWRKWFQLFPIGGLDIRKGPRFSSSDLVIRAAKQGLGIALVRDRLAGDEVRTGSLVRPFGKKSLSLTNAYWIVTAKREERREVVDHVTSWFQSQT